MGPRVRHPELNRGTTYAGIDIYGEPPPALIVSPTMSFRERFKRFRGEVKDRFKRLGWANSPADSITPLPNARTTSANINPVPTSYVAGARTTIHTPEPQLGRQIPLHTVNSLSPSQVEDQVGQNRSNQLVPPAQVIPKIINSTDNNESGPVHTPGFVTGTLDSAPNMNPATPSLVMAQANFQKQKNTAQTSSSLTDSQGLSSAVASITDPIAAPNASGPISGPEATLPVGTTSWKCLSGFRGVLERISGGFGPLKPVLDNLIDIIAIYGDAGEAHQEYLALKSELEALFNTLSQRFSGDIPPAMTIGMNNLCVAIEVELDEILNKREQGAGKRYREANKDIQDVIRCYRRIQGNLERFSLNADLSMWKVVDNLAAENKLNKLAPSNAARYNSAESVKVGRRECTPETRKQILFGLSNWRHDRDQGNMYWLNGMAGTGKTTIAGSLCAMLERSHELGASFFCTQLLPECRNVNAILPTIAYQLARFSRPFYHALSQTLEKDPDLHTKVLSSQFEGLIAEPLHKVVRTLPTNMVVVIDALDECEDSQAVGQLLEILVTRVEDLPIKLFVSSRPEPQIRQKIGSTKSQLILHELEDSIVQEDIRLYLSTELRDLLPFISDANLTTLVERADVLFIYAATVVRYIKTATSTPMRQKRMEGVLAVNSSGYSNRSKDIDALYAAVLTSAFDNPNLEASERKLLKDVLYTIICAQEPLTIDGLAGILGLEDGTWVQAALEPLWSVIHISSGDDVVTTLHASFPDYMLDPTRSKTHGCQREKHHDLLAGLCFDRIKNNKPQFNVCGLESSFIFDNQVSDLEDKVRKAIPPDLSYACCYWAVHLSLGGYSDLRADQLWGFLSARLLLWMEVLNLKNKSSIGASMLSKVREWCQALAVPQEMKDLIHDAWRFATTFATHGVMQSTPHLYVSMLASWPSIRPLANYYIPRTKRLAAISGTGMERRQLALLSTFSAGSSVETVAFSQDGLRIVSGSYDTTIRLWDVTTGTPVMNPLEGHTEAVLSVAFSPDSMHIVSGSRDKTIWLWDAKTGKPVMNPLKGHTDSVNSAEFSHDGARIVSGSCDKTIRLWDARTGKPAMEPLRGHAGSINSVAFSPDGLRIVSSSDDKTVRLWDTTTGKQLVSPLEGHNEAVLSVAFSPDSMRIVSGFRDNTIRLWDATTGKLVMNPLEGHTYPVNSVAFSPDGMHIVSGSYDYTIRLWDAKAGKQVTDPFRGHTSLVYSVAFSPDGMNIVSGSYDHTIRLWDAKTSKLVMDPLEGHTEAVLSVLFWPDGTRIASSSADRRVRLWDAATGSPVRDLLQEHSPFAYSVAFTPESTRIVSRFIGNTIQLWDATTGDILIEAPKEFIDSMPSVAFSPDGMRIASRSQGNTIQLWNAITGEPAMDSLKGHTDLVFPVSFSPDSMRIVSGSYDKTIRVWDAKTGELVMEPLKGHAGPINSVAFSPDGLRIVSSSDDKTVRLWDMTTGKQLISPLEGHTQSVYSVVFSPDGTHVLSCSDDKTIRLWDVKTGKLVMNPLEGHTGSVNWVSFSPDGMRIVSCSGDNTIRLWDATTGKLLINPLEGHADLVFSVAFSPDGRRIVSGSYDNTIRVWDVGTQVSQVSQVSQSQSCKPSLAVSRSWTLDEHGWVRDNQHRLLLWLPFDLRHRLLRPQNPFLISTEGSVELDFEVAYIGEAWVDCYVPALEIP